MAENEHINITVESPWTKHSVFKLPPHITSLNTDAFKPIVVSFGPYHHNEEHLKPMEIHKDRSLDRFCNITKTTLEHLLQSFEPLKQQLMDHYDLLGDEWRDRNCFLKLMIRDGCFMLDLLKSAAGHACGYDDNDPVFGQSGQSIVMHRTIKRDMLLIENQLPLVVLKKLITDNKAILDELMDKENRDCKKAEIGCLSKEEYIHQQIHDLIMNFFDKTETLHLTLVDKIHISDHLCLHALDVFKEIMIQRPIERQVQTEADERPDIASATELRNIGVVFKRKHEGLMDITFKNWVLYLPIIFIDKETKATLLNLMAFENFQACKGREVTTYIYFMASLVSSAKDVSLLRSRRIIYTRGESDEAIAAFFHELAESRLGNPDGSLARVSKSLDEHFERYEGMCKRMLLFGGFLCRMWRSDFNDTYCKTPWKFIGLVAGIILLILSITQTIYTILPYYKKSH